MCSYRIEEMKKYQVKIDEYEYLRTFSFDELLEIGLLDNYDDRIFIRASGEDKWCVARDYPFHISESKYEIDEYGQVIRRGSATRRFDLSTTSLSFSSETASKTINVTSSHSWHISLGAASWVHLTTSNNSLIVKVDKNYNLSSRSDYFRLKSGDEEKTVSVYQSGSSSSTQTPSNNDDGDGCIWAIIIAIAISILASII